MEIEVKVLDINPEKIREKLKKAGAIFLKKVFQRNFIYDYPDLRLLQADSSYVRLRVNEDFETRTKTVILTYKKTISRNKYKTAKEIETSVESFEQMEQFLFEMGLIKRRLDEKIRESYALNNIQIEIDEWAGLPPYLEVEATNEELVEEGLHLLGFSLEQSTSKNLGEVLEMYNIEADNLLFKDFGRSVFE